MKKIALAYQEFAAELADMWQEEPADVIFGAVVILLTLALFVGVIWLLTLLFIKYTFVMLLIFIPIALLVSFVAITIHIGKKVA